MATIYAKLLNQYNFNYLICSSASFYKNNEEDQRSDETGLFIKLNNSRKLAESDNENNDIKSQLEQKIQNLENKESGWTFDKINSRKIKFYQTAELNGPSYVKVASRCNVLINVKNIDEYCLFWSILA